jgi:hypothetical protein
VTAVVINGHVVGWCPDVDPEWEYMDEGEWTPVVDGHLSVLAQSVESCDLPGGE